MKCQDARPLFSPCLDGAATGSEMHELSAHLLHCAECQSQYQMLEKTRAAVSSLGRVQPPADLALRIRVAISQERSRNLNGLLQSYGVHFQNAFNAFMIPATAGLVAAVLLFGVLMGAFVRAQAQGSDDVPISFYTPPRLEPSTYANAMLNLDSSIVIETDVDANGQVQDFRVLSGRDDEETRQQLNRALLFTKFVPAQAFGHRVPGKAVISFSHVSVRG